jgi:uncharacterized membrane protein YdbT with pleckstrin-like domain
MVAVKTKEELNKAIERNEDEILIDDEELARRILQFKRMNSITRRALIGVALLAGIGILLSLFYAEKIPALLAATLTSLAVAGVMIEILLGMGLIGTTALYAFYKVYNIDLVGCSTLKLRIIRNK